jgi:hypothetical protein
MAVLQKGTNPVIDGAMGQRPSGRTVADSTAIAVNAGTE